MTLAQDLRQTLRRLIQTPRYTWLVILMLGLALGAHLAVVSVIDTVLLAPIPKIDADRLFAIQETRDRDSFRSLAYADFVEYQAQTRAFSEIAAHYSTAPLHVDLVGSTELLNGSIASANYFSLLGVEPGLGRFFLADEDTTRGTHPVAVLSDSMWRQRLGAPESVLGSVVTVNNTAFTVVGVAPPGFVGVDAGRPCELWMPTMMADIGSRWCDPLSQRDCRLFEMIGRLRAGQTRATAQTEMDTLSRRLHAAYPLAGSTVRGLEVAPLTGLDSERGRSSRRLVGLLLTVANLLLVVASANLIGLLLGRGLARRREIAVRLALGAPRRRVVALFIGEALVLMAAGGLLGLLVASWAGPVGTVVFETRVPVEVEIRPAVLSYAALLCGVVGIVVGLIPGLAASRPDFVSSIRGESGQAPRRRLLVTVVIIQIAASFFLLNSTGLLIRSMTLLTSAPRAEPSAIATLRLHPRLVSYEPEQAEAVVREVLHRLESLPGVRAVGFAKHRPFWPGSQLAVSRLGDAADAEAPALTTELQPIAPGTLDALGVPLLQGRDVDPRDTVNSAPVLLVNETFADSLWPGHDAVGQRVTLREQTYDVIGVVQDSAYRTLIWGSAPRAFNAFWQEANLPDARFVIRFEGDADAHLSTLRKLVHDVDPTVPVTEVGTVEEQLRSDLSNIDTASRLTGIAGALAVLLSAAGLSGILALAVAQRLREIGIRRALGASHRNIVALVVHHAAVLVVPAVGLGVLAAMAAGPTLEPFLYGVESRDPWILGGTLALIVAIVAVATWWPAHSATRVDPIVTLKS